MQSTRQDEEKTALDTERRMSQSEKKAKKDVMIQWDKDD